MDSHLLDEREVARRLGLSVSTIRYRRRAGLPPKSFKLGGFLVRYRAREVERLAAERQTFAGGGTR
jgi:predicted DNA-binding transcriptional regulator AlpA